VAEDQQKLWTEDEVNLRLIFSRPVCLGAGTHQGPVTNSFSRLEIFFRQLGVCYFVAPSLTRGRVCSLLYNCFLALPEQSLLYSKSRRTHGHILRSHLRLTQPGGPGPRIYIPQGQVRPSYTPGNWVSFLSPLTTRRDCGGGILTRLHTGPQKSSFSKALVKIQN
jgi:hypothetical protein